MQEDPQQLEPIGIKTPILIGAAIVTFFFGVLGLWSALAPMESAAIAPGVLTVDSQRKTIQHLEGGIIAELKVSEGQKVAAGDILIILDQTLPRANLELLFTRYYSAKALESRLLAERDDVEEVEFHAELLAQGDNVDVLEILSSQRQIFTVRRQSLAGQVAILDRRIEQFVEEINGLNGLRDAQDQQISLLDDELESNRVLFDRGLSGKARLRELQREIAIVMGERSQNLAAIARSRQDIDEARLQIAELRIETLNQVVQQLRETQDKTYDLNEQIISARDILQRTVINTTLSGTIVGLQVHTIGGVIAPGQPLMDVVPDNEHIIIEARIDPSDIDVVQTGQLAHIRLSAYKQRNLFSLEGRVTTISADRFSDERTGVDYFLARVELLDELPEGVELYPGMQAEVMVVTGARTLLEYLTRPITQSLNRALRES